MFIMHAKHGGKRGVKGEMELRVGVGGSWTFLFVYSTFQSILSLLNIKTKNIGFLFN